MHVIITDPSWVSKRRSIHLSGTQLLLAGVTAMLVLLMAAAGLYHWVFLKGARENWPVIGSLVRWMVQDEMALRDRFMRDNLDAMARRIGEMQAKLLQLESLSERVAGMAGIDPAQVRAKPGQGGALVEGMDSRPLSMQELQKIMADLERATRRRTDMMAVAESRLFEQKVRTMMIPTSHPVEFGFGSGFGWRIDPFTGRAALHTGIDYQTPLGTPVLAAAGGVVVTSELRPDYGNLVEIDHGKDLITRYAHNSKLLVKKGDLIKRGQRVALSGNTGRSTGPHMHFEVLVRGVPQDPNKFMNASRSRLDQQLRFAATIQPSGLPPRPVRVVETGTDAAPVESANLDAAHAAAAAAAAAQTGGKSPAAQPAPH